MRICVQEQRREIGKTKEKGNDGAEERHYNQMKQNEKKTSTLSAVNLDKISW